MAARAGETITLTYKRFDHKGPLKDTDGNMAPAFVDFVAKNDTTGGSVTGAEGTLVSNTGQREDAESFFNFDAAQAFTTGSNAGGYKLTSVKVPYPTAPPASSHTISIHASNSSNRPGASLGTLAYGTVSGTVGIKQTVTYTASGEGIGLDSGTTYFVVLDTSSGSTHKIKLTASDSEDSGSAEGWSLGNTYLFKATAGTSWSEDSNGNSWQIAIDGAAATATTEGGPQPQSASVAGTELKIVFDKALDETSSESGQHFQVSANDPNDPKGERVETAGTAADVAVSGDTVTVTLAKAVPPGGAASVTYDPPTLSLKAAADDTRVGRFEGFKIETVYDKTVPVLARAAVVQTSKNPDGFRVALYYDEALDPESVPATTDFSLTLDSNAAVTPNAVALEGSAVVLTVDLAKAPEDEAVDQTYTEADVSYTKGTNPIRDLAGNVAAAFTGLEQSELEAKVDVEEAGTPAVVPVTVLADAKLVGNTGQSNDGTFAFTNKTAQAFTTGSNTQGYKVTSVTVPYSGGVPAAASHVVYITLTSVLSGTPLEGNIGVLTYGSVSGTTVTYNAPDGGIDLDAGHTYAVVHSPLSNPSGISTRLTNSDNEDSGAADGWTLADTSHIQSPNWTSRDAAWQIAIHAEKPVSIPGLRAEGARLTVTYDKSLDPASVPGPERFRLLHDAGLGEEVEYGRVAGVTVEGKEALLRTGFDVYPCAGEYPFTLTYASSETDKNLRTMTGELAPDIEAAAVANVRWPECYAAEVSGNSGGGTGQGNQGKSLSLKFDRPLDTGKALKASLFGLAGQSGGTAPAVAGAAYSADGAGVVLTLERALGSGETVTVGYTRPRGEPGLWDAKGRQLADFSGVAVTAPEVAAVTGVELVSDAGEDGTYALGETVRVRVTFSEAVEVEGAPRLKIDMDPAHWGTKQAAYESGSGTAELVFAYEVVQPNESTQGIAVLANTLEANGGTVRAAADGKDARLAHTGLGHDAAHKVDWRLTPAPAGTVSVTAVDLVSDAGEDDTYGLGDRIRVQVTFSEAVSVTGAPRLKIDMDPAHWGAKWAAYEAGSGTASLTFAYQVVWPNESTKGIAVLANTLEANGGTIKSVAGNADAHLSHAGLGHDPAHKIDSRPELSVADAEAKEGTDAAVEFEVTLGHTANHRVTVDYATADGTATAGEDYTATSGTLTFAPGETVKTVSVPILDDVIDEGRETFTLTLSNADGARIVDGEATGTIKNSDPLQKMWLSRFGRTVASHVTEAVSDRLAGPLTGAQVTVGGQTVDLARVQDEAWLGQTLTSVARALGASENREPEGGFGSGPGQSGAGGWPGTGLGGVQTAVPGSSAPAREITGRELLLGSAFHLVRNSENGGPGLAAWGRVTTGGFDGEETTDSGTMRIDGSVTTGILGADAQWNRLLGGVAISVSEGEGTFAQPGVDSGKIESTMTTVSPYARFMVTDRVSVWGLAGWGTGDMTIVQAANEDRGQDERVTRTDLSMRLGAVGGRGALLTQDESGMDLALKADAFYVETTSEAVSNEGDTSADASRVRLVLEGGRAFAMGDGATLRPSLELGLRHDGGDAETGTGVELGGGVAYTDPVTGLSVEAKARMLVAHADSNYEEWGVSGAVRLAPGERQRGLSFSLAPTLGATSSAAERLWGARDAGGLAPGGEFAAARGLQGELGYGMSVFGDRFTGTPNVGFGLSDSARDYRIGWRLTSAIEGDPGFEVNLDATRKEAANGNEPPEHGLMLRGAIRW